MLPTLVSLGTLKKYISINETNTTFDDALKQLARVSTKALENFCRRSFVKQEYTEYFSTRNTVQVYYDLHGDSLGNMEGLLESAGAQRFPLKGFPIDPAADIFVNYDTGRAFGDNTSVASSDFYINDIGNALYLLRATANAQRSLKIVYTAGYDMATDGSGLITGAPEDLQIACVTQVMYFFNKMQENNIGVKGSKKHSPEYVQNAQMLCPEAASMAAPYVRRLVGRG